MIAYLNMNSSKNKITDLRVFLHSIKMDYFVLSETKLESNSLSAQFNLDNYETRGRRGRFRNGG